MKSAPPTALRAWALALLASLLLWNLPFGGVLLYPFKLLATCLHELSHGVMMELWGVGLRGLVIYPDSSGMAYGSGGASELARPFISAAGYMGTPLVGGALLALCRTPTGARWSLLALAGLLATAVATVVDNPFGQRALAAIALAFLIIALIAPPAWRLAAVQFVAAQACIHALLDIRVLFRPVQVVGGREAISDAHAMAQATFGTSERWAVWLWAGCWLAWSLAVCFAAVRLAARPRTGAGAIAPPIAPQ